MNKIAKRMVAGASAAVLFMSAVWSDAFMGLLRGTIYADSVEENGIIGAENFDDPQQDTRIDGAGNKIYNTNYGLHTDKTLSKAYSDGRTFDVDLESWYIGEKPADVGMVLDASGSMAWTTQNPTPIQYDYKKAGLEPNTFLTDEQLKDILTTTNTDNSKISYTGYQYYIYEARASVSEFVPLGYWDGSRKKISDPIESLKSEYSDSQLVGYYPFISGDNYKNQITGNTAKYLASVSDNNIFDSTSSGIAGDAITSNSHETGRNFDKDEEKSEYDAERVLKLASATQNNGGLMLDFQPTDNTFTISFMIQNSKAATSDGQDRANILFIGAVDEDYTQKPYYNVIRAARNSIKNGSKIYPQYDEGASQNHMRIKVSKPDSDSYGNLQSLFNGTGWHQITYVFDEGELYTYKDGESVNSEHIDKLDFSSDTKYGIILGGLMTENYLKTGGSELNFDEVYVFDSALNADQVSKLKSTAHSQKVFAEYDETVAIEGKSQNVIATKANDVTEPGWYYVNSHSDWDQLTDPEIATGKQFRGNRVDYYDDGGRHYYIAPNFATVPLTAGDDLIEAIKAGNDTTPVLVTQTNGTSPVKFFIDKAGYLRCFFNSGDNTKKDAISKFDEIKDGADIKPYTTEVRTQCSLVYQKQTGENGEIKTQTLNRVLNNFVTDLQSLSGNSKISAMRFSNNTLVLNKDKNGVRSDDDDNYEENLKKLLLLDWTSKSDSNNSYSTNLADERYGFEKSTVGQVSGMYNYFLTGGTNTWVGLKAFADNLADEVKSDGNNKYLILFTDGRDTLESDTDVDKVDSIIEDVRPADSSITDSKQLASEWAKKLRNDGYTIFCVMMASGSISPDMPTVAGEDKSEYEKARDFLGTIASNTDYVYAADSKEKLEDAFTSILNQIQKPLTNYTVQDYIDPRFDLVDKVGNVIQFGAGGKITVDSKEFTLTDAYAGSPKFYEYMTKDGRTAKIYYDNKKDMYYLRWDEVTIPGYTSPFEGDSIKATGGKFEVWKSTITLKAKEDFIGGNAILTNGNEAGMNLVFKTGSETVKTGTASENLRDLSGTDKSVDYVSGAPKEDMTPSKGFPRVTCNVRLLDITTKPLNNVIYLGEVVSPAYMLSELEDGYMEGSYYLEYLKRYAHRLYPDDMDTPLLQLLNAWLGINDPGKTDKSFTIPYIYLPNPEYNEAGKITEKKLNNAGGELNQQDIVGYLTYSWERAGEAESQQDGDITKEYVVKDTEQIKYNLKLTFTPLHESDEKLKEFELNENFIEADETFFHVNDDGNFEKNPSNKWEVDTRENFLKALVDDKSGGSTNDVYEWNSGYKPTQGIEQVEADRKYGDAVVDENGFSLVANTTYTKDVVNAGLALELLVKGKDLQTDTNIKRDSVFTFTATRNYDDDLDPLPYKGTATGGEKMNADATNETYQLTFTVKDIPIVTDENDYYTIWPTLTSVTKDGETTYPYPEKTLPIGTYTITYGGGISVNTSKNFTNFNADTNRGNFIFSRFPSEVYEVSGSAAKSTGDAEYLINGTSDFAKENIAETGKDASTNTLTFYFGTDPDGTSNKKGKSRIQDPDSEYTKDRLGIMVLSYGSNNLTISKEVTSKNIPEIQEKAVLDNRWIFDIKLKSTDDLSTSGLTFNLKWTNKEGNTIASDVDHPAKIEFEHVGGTSYEYIPTGGGTISIKSGEQVTILQLPANVTYEVSENRAKQTEANDFREGYRYTIIVDDDQKPSDPNIGTSTGELTPTSAVNFINEFPSPELPSAGGDGINLTVYTGIVLILAGGIWLILLRRKAHSRDKPSEGRCP